MLFSVFYVILHTLCYCNLADRSYVMRDLHLSISAVLFLILDVYVYVFNAVMLVKVRHRKIVEYDVMYNIWQLLSQGWGAAAFVFNICCFQNITFRSLVRRRN